MRVLEGLGTGLRRACYDARSENANRLVRYRSCGWRSWNAPVRLLRPVTFVQPALVIGLHWLLASVRSD
jgi:ribosomal protein L15E